MGTQGSRIPRRRAWLGMLAALAVTLSVGLAYAGGEEDLRAGRELAQKGDYTGALAKWRSAVEAGNFDAAFLVGLLYESGRGVEQDYAEAADWYRKAADGGVPDAMYHLGILRDLGRGVNESKSKALRWFRKAAEAGHAAAMSTVGLFYERGKGVKKDYKKALHWYRKAADIGNAIAQGNVGLLYEKGRGVEQDYGEALRWYRKAAAQGYVPVMTYIGDFYNEGRGVKQDFAEAARWYLEAAQGGDRVAAHRIGHMYVDGRGIERDFGKALPFFQAFAKTAPDDHYHAMRIWQCLMRTGKPDEARAFLTKHRAERKPKGWIAAILAFLSEDGDEAKLLKRAKSKDAKKQKERLCEAHYWIGSKKLIANDAKGAREHFRKCVATGVTDFLEYTSAQVELKRME